jgi:hypothetical protein
MASNMRLVKSSVEVVAIIHKVERTRVRTQLIHQVRAAAKRIAERKISARLS